MDLQEAIESLVALNYTIEFNHYSEDALIVVIRNSESGRADYDFMTDSYSEFIKYAEEIVNAGV